MKHLLIALTLLLLIPTTASADQKIHQGKPAVGLSPHTVAIGEEYDWLEHSRPHCTGIAISPTKVLTAAHCVIEFDHTRLYVYALASNIKRTTPFSVRLVQHHPRHDPENLKNDVVILHLTTPLPLRNYPAIRMHNNTSPTIALGYGETENGDYLDDLRYTELPAPSVSGNCLDQQHPTAFCIPVGPNGQDTCYGDSGGPILQSGFLIGLTSFGPESCGLTFGQYADLGPMKTWIMTSPRPACNKLAPEPVTSLKVRKRVVSWTRPCGAVEVYRVSNGSKTLYSTTLSIKVPTRGLWFVASIRPNGQRSPEMRVFVK